GAFGRLPMKRVCRRAKARRTGQADQRATAGDGQRTKRKKTNRSRKIRAGTSPSSTGASASADSGFSWEVRHRAPTPSCNLTVRKKKRTVLMVQASELVRDRQVLRVRLPVSQADEILYVDRVNLASLCSRRRVIDELNAKQIILPDEALLALEQACRRTPA